MVNPATKHPDKGGISTTVAIVDSWCHELLLKIEKLEKTVVLLENDNKNQKEVINELKKRLDESSESSNGRDGVNGGGMSGSSNLFQYSSLFNSKSKSNEAQKCFAAQVVKVNKEIEKIACNVVVRGLTETQETDLEKIKEHDMEQLERVLGEIGVDPSRVKSIKRIRKRVASRGVPTAVSSTGATANGNIEAAASTAVNAGSGETEGLSDASESTRGPDTTGPALLLVEFESTEVQAYTIRNAYKLKNSGSFNKIYINEDKIKAVRDTEAKQRKARNAKNEKLKERDEKGRRFETRDGKRWCWGIRSGEFKWIELND